MGLGKLEGLITVPTGGYSMTVTDSGGTKSVTVLTAGTYYLNSTTSLLTTIGTALTADSTLAGTYTLSTDDTASTATGKTTITITGGGASITVAWDSTTLRDVLGFTAGLSGAATYTSTSSSPYIYLPNQRRCNPMAPDGYKGVPVTDASFTMSSTGTSKVLKYATRYHDNLEFAFLSGTKTWTQFEVTPNESLESFFNTVISNGYPFRYHNDRSVDATFATFRSMQPMDLMVKPEFAGFVGSGSDGSSLSWHYGPTDIIQYN